MISKAELLKILEDARDAEEKSIPIYTKHLGPSIFWTGTDREKAAKAREMLQRLAQESNYHKNIVENLINKIKEEDRDAF